MSGILESAQNAISSVTQQVANLTTNAKEQASTSTTAVKHADMSHVTPNPPIIFFHYPFSPWSQKVTAYLALRGIPYTSCEQPLTMPRPNLASLGVAYRRIPVMSVGRDIYCDTLLMLEKIDQLFPYGKYGNGIQISQATPQNKALERLLEKWTDVVVFKFAAAAIPPTHPAIGNKDFTDDRKALWGREWTFEHQSSLRPEALSVLRANMSFLEDDLLTDGRDWIFAEDKQPGLADIHAAWIFTWLRDMDDALPTNLFSREIYPKTWAWFDRYQKAIKEAMQRHEPNVRNISGDEAVKEITSGPFGDKVSVDPKDPSGLKEGDKAIAFPIDTGFNNKDKGKLVGLSVQETVLEVNADAAHGGVPIHIHHPRWNFAVEADKSS